MLTFLCSEFKITVRHDQQLFFPCYNKSISDNQIIYTAIDEKFKEDTKQVLPAMLDNIKRIELAKTRIRLFSAMLYRLLIEEERKYDLIIAPGNSGAYMAKLAKWVYDYLEIKALKTVFLPFY